MSRLLSCFAEAACELDALGSHDSGTAAMWALATGTPRRVGPTMEAQHCFENGKIFNPVYRDAPRQPDDRSVSYQATSA